ncbi:MAG: o-succinylbenzoate synthase [Candidatus Kapabacteria bacterium]|nr:o-succinylbenzoate synthase [Candidatus Kapabacteria bacterium]
MSQTITRLECWRYSLPLREPLTIPNGALARREGLLICCVNDAGAIGIGEIAPLQGLHDETFIEAEHNLLSALPLVLANEHLSLTALSQTLLPSVRCGVEMALQSLKFRINTAALPSARVPLNALVSGTKDTILRRAVSAVQEGYTTLKIKVGRHSLEDDIANVRAVRKEIGSAVRIRLDANRTWALETALVLGRALSDCDIEYIEEPVRNPDDIEEFFRNTTIRVGLDEMLYAPDKQERLRRFAIPDDALAAYILKPSLIGGIHAATALAEEAATRNLDAVVSSVFETGIALGFYAMLQAQWNHHRLIPCGLDTFKFLAEDVLQTPFAAEQGFVSLPDVFLRQTELRYNALTRLA